MPKTVVDVVVTHVETGLDRPTTGWYYSSEKIVVVHPDDADHPGLWTAPKAYYDEDPKRLWDRQTGDLSEYRVKSIIANAKHVKMRGK
jgi:hypothetical protein